MCLAKLQILLLFCVSMLLKYYLDSSFKQRDRIYSTLDQKQGIVIPILQNEATDVNQESLAVSKFLNCVSVAGRSPLRIGIKPLFF